MKWSVIPSRPSEEADRGLTVSFQFFYPLNRREAVSALAKWFVKAQAGWFALRGAEWLVDLDALRDELGLSSNHPDLDGLVGKVVVVPEYEVEQGDSYYDDSIAALSRAKKTVHVRLVFQFGSLQDALETEEQRRTRHFDERHFHHEVVSYARGLFIGGHLRQGVHDVSIRIIELVTEKSGLESDAYPLMLQAFKPTSPILKLNKLETQVDKDEQHGFQFLFAGMVLAFRNTSSHATVVGPSDETDALEQLAFLSLLLRRLHTATKTSRS